MTSLGIMKPMWSPEAITGYRVWSVRHDRLDGMYRPWSSPSHVAECGNRRPRSAVPHVGDRCECGIYAVKDPVWLATQFPGLERPHVAMGVVAMSGRVVEHTLGYRAERATVSQLAIRTRRGIWRSNDQSRIRDIFAAPGQTLRSAPASEFVSGGSLASALA